MSVITFSRDKRAISIMIGYILLITSAVVMSAIVYQWMKSYVPTESVDCPDGVSIFVTNSICAEQPDGTYKLTLYFRNNGRFDIAGYFIHATDSEEQELATIDLSSDILSGGEQLNNAIVFNKQTPNFLSANKEITSVFNLSTKLYSVEIIPFRSQVYDNKRQTVSCGKAKITEKLTCGPETSEELECTQNSDCNEAAGEICNSNNECSLCGNGVVNSGESCDSVTGCSDQCTALPSYSCSPTLNICS